MLDFPTIESLCQRRATLKQVGDYLPRQLKCAPRVRILVSPYVRARQTGTAIERALAAAAIRFDKREATELWELEYGLFDGIADEDLPKIFPREYEHYDKHKADAMSRTGSRASLGRSCVIPRSAEPIQSLILPLSATASRSELFAELRFLRLTA
jgi:broad specificity phosphatase PhoE